MPTDPRILPSTMGGTTLGGTTSSLRLDAYGECATKHPVQQSRARSKDEWSGSWCPGAATLVPTAVSNKCRKNDNDLVPCGTRSDRNVVGGSARLRSLLHGNVRNHAQIQTTGVLVACVGAVAHYLNSKRLVACEGVRIVFAIVERNTTQHVAVGNRRGSE